jgi:hypothetical protein
MRVRRIEQTALTAFLLAACALFFVAAYTAVAHAQNPSSSLTVPQQPEIPVSPTTPGTLPGTEAGPGTAVGTNPITGQPLHRRRFIGTHRRLAHRADDVRSTGRTWQLHCRLAAKQ